MHVKLFDAINITMKNNKDCICILTVDCFSMSVQNSNSLVKINLFVFKFDNLYASAEESYTTMAYTNEMK